MKGLAFGKAKPFIHDKIASVFSFFICFPSRDREFQSRATPPWLALVLELELVLEQVLQQIRIIELAHAQNPLPVHYGTEL